MENLCSQTMGLSLKNKRLLDYAEKINSVCHQALYLLNIFTENADRPDERGVN